MTPWFDRALFSRSKYFPAAASIGTVLAGISVLAGWHFGVVTRTALVAGLSLGAFGILIYLIAHTLHRTDQDRLKAEEALKKNEHYYRALIENATDIITIINPDSTFRYVSPSTERVLGYKPEEMVGRIGFLFVHPDDHGRLKAYFAEGLKNPGSMHTSEIRFKHRDGSYRMLECMARYLAQDAVVNGIIVNARDITERRRADEAVAKARDAAVESARIKSEFMANMSHEIRTPMNAIIGMSSLLLDTRLTAQQREFASIVRNASDSLLQIINDVLDFSKIEAGKFTLESIDVDVRTTVDEVSRMLAERAQSKGIELACLVYAEVSSVVLGDPGRLRQVLTNLLGNAVKFTEHGEVTLQVKSERQTESHDVLRFIVKDTGVGISNDAQARLFNAFTQADGSTTRRFGGTGLGLAISKHIVELMGGEIGVTSVEGQGSEFWFTVPFKKSSGRSAASARSPQELHGIRILIVDDNETNRKIVEHQVSAWGMTIGTSASGAEALDMLRRQVKTDHPYDLVILDMQMPGMDGLSLAQIIHSEPPLERTRLVMMTSLGNIPDETTLRQAGLGACLGKPVRESELFDCLASVMAAPSGIPAPQAVPKSDDTVSSVPIGTPSSVRILLAEDNVVNQQVALFQLTKLGYKAHVAVNGRQVLESLKHTHYDVILMDCQMPELDGYQTTVEIRWQEGKSRHIPIIAMTANALEGDRKKCLDAGMDDYISKPIKIADLKAKLAQWMATPSLAAVAPAAKPPPVAETSAPPLTIDMHHLREATDHDEPGMRRLVDIYLSETAKELAHLESAVDLGDAKEIHRLAHGTAGASATYGMPAMAALLRKMEHLGRDEKLFDTHALMKEARVEFTKIQTFWKSYLEGPSDQKAA